MDTLINHLTSIGFDFAQALLGVGLVIALVKVIIGHKDGCAHLTGILVAAILLALWHAGELAQVFQSLIDALLSGSSTTSPF